MVVKANNKNQHERKHRDNPLIEHHKTHQTSNLPHLNKQISHNPGIAPTRATFIITTVKDLPAIQHLISYVPRAKWITRGCVAFDIAMIGITVGVAAHDGEDWLEELVSG